MKKMLAAALGITIAASMVWAEDSNDAPRPVPLTRPEMKRLLEDMKGRTPRIPLPPLSEAEKAELGERGGNYESRLRQLYLGGEARGGGRGGRPGGAESAGAGGREADPKASLDNAFKVQLFWIVSRANNCQYCLGHQESKLLRAGKSEESIAKLDSQWSDFTPAEQAAFAFAHKITLLPHEFDDADFASLKAHFNDMQILEMVLSTSGNNSINRWKEGVGVPQSAGGGGFGSRANRIGENPVPTGPHSYETPTPDAFKDKFTTVAPFVGAAVNGKICPAQCRRPGLETRVVVEKALQECRTRKSRLPLVAQDEARKLVPNDFGVGTLPAWVRLLANFSRDGQSRIAGFHRAFDKGELPPLLKAQLRWIVARQDRSWYAVGLAKDRLRQLGVSEDDIYKLDGDWSAFDEKDRALFTVAKKLAASPVVLTDNEVSAAVKLAGPKAVVQVVDFTTNLASFDRIVQVAGLPLD